MFSSDSGFLMRHAVDITQCTSRTVLSAGTGRQPSLLLFQQRSGTQIQEYPHQCEHDDVSDIL